MIFDILLIYAALGIPYMVANLSDKDSIIYSRKLKKRKGKLYYWLVIICVSIIWPVSFGVTMYKLIKK